MILWACARARVFVLLLCEIAGICPRAAAAAHDGHTGLRQRGGYI